MPPGLARGRPGRLESTLRTAAVRLGQRGPLGQPPYPRPPWSAHTSASVTREGPPPRLPGVPRAVSLATAPSGRARFPGTPRAVSLATAPAT